jgi:site-specific recombinase
MTKRLSDQLRDLSIRAKKAEDAFDAAQKEASERLVARREQARSAAIGAINKVNEEVQSVKDTTSRNWNALQAKIAADVEALKQKVAQQKQALDIKLAEKNAERLEWEAQFAIDYAIASVEQASMAVLDALAGRIQAENLKQKPTV